MARWALLKHTTPDGAFHYDWLMEPSGVPEAALITFRVFERPDDAGVDRLAAQRLADHRRVYLEYEGPLTGGRGSVERVGEGTCEVIVDGAVFEVEIEGAVRRRWRGVRAEPRGDVYVFRAVG
jgi:hypothetical protein